MGAIPAAGVNQVTWTEACSVYATETWLQPGATITQIANAPAQPGWVYLFNEGGLEGQPANLGEVFKVVNNLEGPFAFGLAQQVTVSGNPMLAPLNAVTVPFNEAVNLTPTEIVSICLAPLTSNGVVLSQVPSNALTVNLGGQAPTAVIGFDDATGTFYLVPPANRRIRRQERLVAATCSEAAAADARGGSEPRLRLL